MTPCVVSDSDVFVCEVPSVVERVDDVVSVDEACVSSVIADIDVLLSDCVFVD